MTTDLVEKCARALAKAAGHATWEDLPNTEADALNSVQNGATACCKDDYRIGALAVIDALADGVSDEMCAAAYEAWHAQERSAPPIRAAIAAAIRASREGNGNG